LAATGRRIRAVGNRQGVQTENEPELQKSQESAAHKNAECHGAGAKDVNDDCLFKNKPDDDEYPTRT
jgi:hypothetical protein